MNVTSKRCAICLEYKPLSEFYANKLMRTGKDCYCIPCRRAYTKQHAQKNKEAVYEMGRSYRRRNRDKIRRRQRAWANDNREHVNKKSCEFAANNPDARKSYTLKNQYGITLEDYNNLCAAQNGVCAICARPERAISRYTKKAMTLAVDHNHATGKIRGLLCGRCNRGLGMFDDDPARMTAAIKYLEAA